MPLKDKVRINKRWRANRRTAIRVRCRDGSFNLSELIGQCRVDPPVPAEPAGLRRNPFIPANGALSHGADRPYCGQMRATRRRWITWIALLSLLFQQLAMAAYVCPQDIPQTPARSQPPCHVDPTDPRCGEHCNPHQQVAGDLTPLTVPMAMIPSSWTWVPAVSAGAVQWIRRHERSCVHGPPFSIRYCSLLI